MTDRTAVLFQYLIPKQAITALAGRIARARGGLLTTRLIAWFVQRYRVNMQEAAKPDIASYASMTFSPVNSNPVHGHWCPAR